MSILLESLGNQSKPQETGIPDIHASHFDDDMLGDEWLIQRVKVWRLISLLLTLLLLSSWGGFYYYHVNFQADVIADLKKNKEALKLVDELRATALATEKRTQLLEDKLTSDSIYSKSELNSLDRDKDKDQIQTNLSADQVLQDTATENSSPNTQSMQVYKPVKRQQIPATSPLNTAATPQKNSQPKVTQSKTTGSALFKEELSPQMQAEFPNLIIDSFVVADTPKDSFVILDGGFYTVNQVIAPGLILREINRQQIVVEFHSQRVKLPLN